MIDYQNFIATKRHTSSDSGINPIFLPDYLFDYQSHVADRTIRKGRSGVFMDTGLGKTLIELVTATNHVLTTNKRVLILTPLAVAFQFLKEAETFGIDEVTQTKDGQLRSKIVLCNYERMDKLDPTDFDVIILDESSILKNFDGKTRTKVISFMKKIRYRYLFTATPSPNDYTELGNSSEALGYLGYTDMLTKYFTNNEDTISPMNIGTQWVLKGHAKKAFFEWVSSWSISMRKPSDLRFSDESHVLPPLYVNKHEIKNKGNAMVGSQMAIFNDIKRRLTDIKTEQRETITDRCEKAVELATKYDTSIYWVNFNKEADLITLLDPNAIQIKGGMNIDKKEELLMAFSSGEIKKLVTKPKMTAFGLNWQHCGHHVYFPTFSFEQYYQSIRRSWRFGRKDPVEVDLVYSDGQKRVIDSLLAKEKKANTLFSSLNANINQEFKSNFNGFDQSIKIPAFV